MQKLVKRKMHYETIMPVEAYECEEKDPLIGGRRVLGYLKGFYSFVVATIRSRCRVWTSRWISSYAYRLTIECA